MRAKVVAVIAATACSVALLPIQAADAGAPNQWEVGIGAYLNNQGLKQVSMRFFPDELDVLQGDIIHFTSQGQHTATLLAPDVDAAAWRAEFASTNKDDTYSLLESDEDEGASALKMNPAVAFPSSTACGTSAEDPCPFGSDYTSTEPGTVLNSGLLNGGGVDFYVRVDQTAGTSFEAITLTNPNMSLTVNVVTSADDLETPEEIEQAVASTFAADQTAAAALHNTWKAKKPQKTVNNKGAVTWGVWAGVDQVDAQEGAGGIALRYMYPSKITLKKNQSVQWKFAQLRHVAQTVTLPVAKAVAMADGFRTITCDPDGDTAQNQQPDHAPADSEFPYCDSPLEIEIDISNDIAKKTGDANYTGAGDNQHSGLLGASPATSNAPYKLKFTKASPKKKPFKVASATHPFMKQTLVVKP